MTIPSTLSPMMQQWHDLKIKAKEALLLFRLGDFYEAFYEDAKILSEILDITLTKRQDVPMSGIPYHSCSNYLDQLLTKGFKIAIAEQIENPKESKGLVKRDIVKILSPGATGGAGHIDDTKHHFISFVSFKNQKFGLVWLDISLQTCFFEVLNSETEVMNLLSLIGPKELLVESCAQERLIAFKHQLPSSILYSETFDIRCDDSNFLEQVVLNHFSVYSLNSLGLDEFSAFIIGKLLHILKTERLYDLKNITKITHRDKIAYLLLDKSTLAHLEIFEKKEGKYQNLTLFNHLNHTLTLGGSRLFESWLKSPLISKKDIIKRQMGVQFFVLWEKTSYFSQHLKKIKDIQKILSKINLKTAGPQDLKHLQNSLSAALELKAFANSDMPDLLQVAFSDIHCPLELIELYEKALLETPSIRLTEGPTFKKGFHQELDELLYLSESQDEFLKDYENRLKEETGIKTLKVGSSKNFGFYIEISKGQSQNAPSYFIRRQTLTNAERFMTEELSLFEKKAFEAKTKLHILEHSLFEHLCLEALKYFSILSQTQEALSLLDVLQSLSKQALKKGYTLPEISDRNELVLKQARHPIIEELISENSFIPNDLNLSKNPESFMLITGPNMGGKSTYMRQIAMCVIMAQIGSYVPARFMRLSPCDKLFTRIGASDDITSGQSTFMVEMAETSYILKNATESSLVILDEIGRGTSTYDGIAIAYAICKYLLQHPEGLPKTLFATHYFELTDLDQEDPRVINFHAGVKEDGGRLIFLHKIIQGPADKSYGIQVAKLAGLPEFVIKGALEKQKCLLDPSYSQKKTTLEIVEDPPSPHPLCQDLVHLELNTLTPLEALNLLSVWKKKYQI